MANESFTRQCLRCQAFYENENEQCRYHSHKYVENTHSIREGALTGWPCCRYSKASLVNEKAFHRDYPGCQVADSHVEDIEFTVMMRKATGGNPGKLSNARAEMGPGITYRGITAPLPSAPPLSECFDFEEEERKVASGSASATEDDLIVIEELLSECDAKDKEKEKEKEKEEKEKKEEDFFEHHVDTRDTLFKLALRYDVTVEALKRANRIAATSNLIHHHKVLLIPRNPNVQVPPQEVPAETHAARVRRLVHLSQLEGSTALGEGGKLSSEEASYYLVEGEGDVDKALSLWREAIKWEICSPKDKCDYQTRSTSTPTAPTHSAAARLCFACQ